MNEFDEISCDFDDENSHELVIATNDWDEAAFKILTIAKVDQMMKQYIDDVKTIVQVVLLFAWLLLFSLTQTMLLH